MKVKDLKKWYDTMDPEADIVVSKPFIIDADEQILGIVDLPVLGMAYNKENHAELRFLVGVEDVVKTMIPGEIKFADEFKEGNTP